MLKRTGHITVLGEALEGMLREQALREPLRPHTARAIWAQVVGPEIAAASSASGVRGGVLFVTVRSAVWANELGFYKQDILNKLNTRLGEAVLSDIHFKVSGGGLKSPPKVLPEPDRPDDEALDGIEPAGPLANAAAARHGVGDDKVDAVVEHVLLQVARMQTWKREHGWRECASCATLYDPHEPGADKAHCLYCITMRRYRTRY